MMNIQEITIFRPELTDVINRFLVQLAGEEYQITNRQIEAIISDPNSHLFFAANDDGKYMGMISIGLYVTPTGRKAWIEDVVVDDSCRGEGVGKSLTLFAIQYAKDHEADVVMLTSKPARISANHLYRKTGFEQKVTNVYTMLLK